MEDFNSYVFNEKNKKNDGNIPNNMDKNLFNLINSLAGKFDGKSQSDLIKAIYDEAKRGKQNGTLSNAEISHPAILNINTAIIIIPTNANRLHAKWLHPVALIIFSDMVV